MTSPRTCLKHHRAHRCSVSRVRPPPSYPQLIKTITWQHYLSLSWKQIFRAMKCSWVNLVRRRSHCTRFSPGIFSPYLAFSLGIPPAFSRSIRHRNTHGPCSRRLIASLPELFCRQPLGSPALAIQGFLSWVAPCRTHYLSSTVFAHCRFGTSPPPPLASIQHFFPLPKTI